MRVAWLSDVEGMWQKVVSFCRQNPCVSLEEDGRLVVADGSVFVFGGDAIDRGPHGRRIVRTLLEAKKRQPSQVVLLAGNRDLNKLRLSRELAGHPPSRMPEDVRTKSRPELLRWITANTMGAKDAFEFRRQELVEEQRPSDDESVVQSFLDDFAPGGDHFELLVRSQLAFRSGRTLFVHGGVTEQSILSVPGRSPSRDAEAWIADLNGWYDEQLDAYRTERFDASGEPGWAGVVAYQAPLPGTRLNQASVVYGRTADKLNNPELPSREAIERLLARGMQRVVVGHTPNGDLPSVLRTHDFEMVISDASHSRVAGAPQLLVDDAGLEIAGETLLDDGTRLETRFAVPFERHGSPVGRRLAKSGHLVKGRLDTGPYVLFRYGAVFQYEQVLGAPLEVEAGPLQDPFSAVP